MLLDSFSTMVIPLAAIVVKRLAVWHWKAVELTIESNLLWPRGSTATLTML